MRIDLKAGLKKSAASEKKLEKSIDRSEENRLNGRPFQIQTSGFGRSGELGRGKTSSLEVEKLFLKKMKIFKKKY